MSSADDRPRVPFPISVSSHCALSLKEAAAACPVPLGFLLSPNAALHETPARLCRPPSCCAGCGAFANLYCGLVQGTAEWKCVFCSTANAAYSSVDDLAAADMSSGEGMQLFPELTHKLVDYVDIDSAAPRVYGSPSASASAGAPSHSGRAESLASLPSLVLVVDVTMSAELLAGVASAVGSLLASLPPHMPVSFVTCSGVVSIYEAGLRAAVADVFSGASSPLPSDLRRIASHEAAPSLPGGEFSVSASRCAHTLPSILHALSAAAATTTSSPHLAELPAAGEHPPATAAAAAAAAAPPVGRVAARRAAALKSAARLSSASGPRRALGPAIEYALELTRRAKCPAGRVVVIAGGAANYGPGSLTSALVSPYTLAAAAPAVAVAAAAAAAPESYYRAVGARACALVAAVDVFLVGFDTFNASTMLALTNASAGGALSLIHDCGTDFARSLVACCDRPLSPPSHLSVRVSDGLAVAHVIGPVLDAASAEALAASPLLLKDGSRPSLLPPQPPGRA